MDTPITQGPGQQNPQVTYQPGQQTAPAVYQPGQQGMQQQNTAVVVSQQPQQQQQLLLIPVCGHREWTSGLFDCTSDGGGSLYTCCFYCCALTSLAISVGETVSTTMCVPGADINIRTKIRTLGGIRGSMCNDCLVMWCCGPCAVCQEIRELKAMGIFTVA